MDDCRKYKESAIGSPIVYAFLDSAKADNRFELTEKFLKYNMELANDRTNEENTHLFKKVGSNFEIKERTVLFEPRGAWKILSDSEFFGGECISVEPSARPHFGFKCGFPILAEDERFELSGHFRSRQFSKLLV